MSERVAERFVEALAKLEGERDVETISALFADESEIGNVVSPEKFYGREGAREFWGAKYRDRFGEVKSTFRNVIRTGTNVALEWTTQGTASDGTPVRYPGVSILETDSQLITRFCAYFDGGQARTPVNAEGARLVVRRL